MDRTCGLLTTTFGSAVLMSGKIDRLSCPLPVLPMSSWGCPQYHCTVTKRVVCREAKQESLPCYWSAIWDTAVAHILPISWPCQGISAARSFQKSRCGCLSLCSHFRVLLSSCLSLTMKHLAMSASWRGGGHQHLADTRSNPQTTELMNRIFLIWKSGPNTGTRIESDNQTVGTLRTDNTTRTKAKDYRRPIFLQVFFPLVPSFFFFRYTNLS